MSKKEHQHSTIFVNRRTGRDRRLEEDPCQEMPLDLFHRKRRKTPNDRRATRTLAEDFDAYMASNGFTAHFAEIPHQKN